MDVCLWEAGYPLGPPHHQGDLRTQRLDTHMSIRRWAQEWSFLRYSGQGLGAQESGHAARRKPPGHPCPVIWG